MDTSNYSLIESTTPHKLSNVMDMLQKIKKPLINIEEIDQYREMYELYGYNIDEIIRLVYEIKSTTEDYLKISPGKFFISLNFKYIPLIYFVINRFICSKWFQFESKCIINEIRDNCDYEVFQTHEGWQFYSYERDRLKEILIKLYSEEFYNLVTTVEHNGKRWYVIKM